MSHKDQISYSQIASYLSCKRKWYYEYVRELAPRVTSKPMQLGTLVHAYLEASLKGSPVDGPGAIEDKIHEYFTTRDMFDEEKQFTRELGTKAAMIGFRAYERFIEIYEPINYGAHGKLVEYAFNIPTVDEKSFVGTIDAVVRERATDAIWVVDHKIRQQLQPIENEMVNLQMVSYQYALKKDLGIESVGSISHQIFHELPKVPKTNQNGSMSKTDIKTDWETYRNAVVDAGLNPSDYHDMAIKLSTKEFYRESKAYRSYTEIENTWIEIIEPTIMDIIDTKDRFTRNLSIWNCIGCKFQDLCLEELRGVDVDYKLQHEFVRNSYLDKYKEHDA